MTVMKRRAGDKNKKPKATNYIRAAFHAFRTVYPRERASQTKNMNFISRFPLVKRLRQRRFAGFPTREGRRVSTIKEVRYTVGADRRNRVRVAEFSEKATEPSFGVAVRA